MILRMYPLYALYSVSLRCDVRNCIYLCIYTAVVWFATLYSYQYKYRLKHLASYATMWLKLTDLLLNLKLASMFMVNM